MGSQVALFNAIAARLTAIHYLKDLCDTTLASGADPPDFRRDQTAHADPAEHLPAAL
jgi:hypothetical protein